MHLTFGMGVFWLFIAWAAEETIVKTAQALSRRGGKASNPDLERRVRELEQRLADQASVIEARELSLISLEEKVEFTNRLLAERAASSPGQGT